MRHFIFTLLIIVFSQCTIAMEIEKPNVISTQERVQRQVPSLYKLALNALANPLIKFKKKNKKIEVHCKGRKALLVANADLLFAIGKTKLSNLQFPGIIDKKKFKNIYLKSALILLKEALKQAKIEGIQHVNIESKYIRNGPSDKYEIIKEKISKFLKKNKTGRLCVLYGYFDKMLQKHFSITDLKLSENNEKALQIHSHEQFFRPSIFKSPQGDRFSINMQNDEILTLVLENRSFLGLYKENEKNVSKPEYNEYELGKLHNNTLHIGEDKIGYVVTENNGNVAGYYRFFDALDTAIKVWETDQSVIYSAFDMAAIQWLVVPSGCDFPHIEVWNLQTNKLTHELILSDDQRHQLITRQLAEPRWSSDGNKIVLCHNVWPYDVWSLHSESLKNYTLLKKTIFDEELKKFKEKDITTDDFAKHIFMAKHLAKSQIWKEFPSNLQKKIFTDFIHTLKKENLSKYIY